MNTFETFKLKFNNRRNFEKAFAIISSRHSEFDAGHSDLVLSFFSIENANEMSNLFSILGIKHEKEFDNVRTVS